MTLNNPACPSLDIQASIVIPINQNSEVESTCYLLFVFLLLRSFMSISICTQKCSRYVSTLLISYERVRLIKYLPSLLDVYILYLAYRQVRYSCTNHLNVEYVEVYVHLNPSYEFRYETTTAVNSQCLSVYLKPCTHVTNRASISVQSKLKYKQSIIV